MSKILLLMACIICLAARSSGQSNPLDAKLKMAYEFTNKGDYDAADSFIDGLLKENPGYGDGWDLLVQVRYKLYEKSKESANLFKSLTVSSSKDGKQIDAKGDTLGRQLMDMLKKMDPSKMAYSKFEYTLRKATLLSPEAWQSSTYMRLLYVDPNIDSNVNKKALRDFEEGEKEFEQKNYNKAALLYKKAIEEQPDFYKASLYMGDCYYATENYKDAAEAFKEAVKRFPNLLEPRKYLCDAYAKLSAYESSAQAAMEAMTVYPDYTMFQKLEDALYLNHQALNIQRTQRGVFPNRMEDTSENDPNTYRDTIPATGPWMAYQAAYNKMKPYCNKKGLIVKANKLTSSKYLEVYSWEEMLKNSNDKILDEARRMQKLNYLDCYVLVTCFHQDLYPQYLDLVTNHRDRVLAYFKAFIKSQ